MLPTPGSAVVLTCAGKRCANAAYDNAAAAVAGLATFDWYVQFPPTITGGTATLTVTPLWLLD